MRKCLITLINSAKKYNYSDEAIKVLSKNYIKTFIN